MKLFTKTLLFFIGIIAFQSILTVLLIVNFTRRSNFADAQRELEDEASILYDSFNSWKRQIWISLNGIRNDQRLARLLISYRGHPPKEDFTGSLKDFIFVSKVDYLVLQDPLSHALDITPITYSTFDMEDLRDLANEKPYPYLELRLIRGVLCLIGVTAMDLAPDNRLNVFLLKRLDPEFCAQLTLNRKSRVALFIGSQYLVGSFPSRLPASILDPSRMRGAYLERYEERLGGADFNIAFQGVGFVRGAPGAEEIREQTAQTQNLFLGTFLSDEPYNQRILLVSRALLLVSLAGALLTIVLSLFLSRNITHPIADLLAAMGRIKAGAYDTRVGTRSGFEIGLLFNGFDDMAREIAQSRAAMQEYLKETVLLKEYNEKIINSIKTGIAIVDKNLRVEKANSSFVESFSLAGKEITGTPLTWLGIDIVDETVVDTILSLFRRERDSFAEVKRSANGKVYQIKLYPFSSIEGGVGEIAGCVFDAEDISAKTELEHKIFQAEKLSSISMLSAGMAHEINNPLGSILTNVQNLIEDEHDGERTVSLRWIEQETKRIARIVQELLKFATTDAGHPPGSDVNTVVGEALRLIGYSLARESRIRIDARLQEGLSPSVVSRDELKQVVINLVKNSIQAIEGPGRILVCTRPAPSGRGVVLSIADTGKGIPPEIVSRIFDPFFTTKVNGEGTGLGLSVVYGIVTKYSGGIQVKSREGKGTRMAVTLPVLGAGRA
jgi:signal transduction histidine kinase